MKNFLFSEFNENIIKRAVLENGGEKVTFILPTYLSKNQLNRIYQEIYGIADVHFFTMQEFKENLFCSQKAIVKEDKRNLLLYSVLSELEKEYFHISDYFSAIKFMNEFFAFFTELNEGLITKDKLFETLYESTLDISKQITTIDVAYDIAERYKKQLEKYDYTDKIFLHKKNNLPHYIEGKAVVVNQFYFTELEKEILNRFENADIYLQMPRDLYDTDKMKLSGEFSSKFLKHINTQRIEYTLSSDKFSSYIAMINNLREDATFIIDLDFKNFAFKNMLNPKYFNVNLHSFKNTALFDFLLVITDIIQSMKNGMTNLKSLAGAFQSDSFKSFFNLDSKTSQKMLTVLYQLNDNDIKFIDENYWKKHLSVDLSDKLNSLNTLLKKLISIADINDFIYLFYNILDINKIGVVSEYEAEVFYQSLYDILSLQEILNDNLKTFVNAGSVAVFYLKLLLNHLKYKSFKNEKTENSERYFFTSLLDTRNMGFENVVFINLISGKLPSAPKSGYFLTEKQKDRLNLLTYDDLRLREKYYFLRLIASSKNVYLYSYKDLENNIEPSAFVEDLLLKFPYKKIIKTKTFDKLSYKNLYKALIDSGKKRLLNGDEVFISEDFFKFNADTLSELRLSPTLYLKLKYSPFIYYLEKKLKLPKYNTEFKEEFSPLFLGLLVHSAFAELFHKIKISHKFPDEKMIFNKTLYATQALEKALSKITDFKYKKNYNEADIYFDSFFKMFLKDSMENFIYLIYKKIMNEKVVKYIPESEHNRLIYKKFADYSGVSVYITGFSDLRIETRSKNYIVDYKTSSPSEFNILKPQLKFYEYYYYKDLEKELESAFYFVFDEILKSVLKNSRSKTLQKIIEELIDNIKSGYVAYPSANQYTNFDITRADRKRQSEAKIEKDN